MDDVSLPVPDGGWGWFVVLGSFSSLLLISGVVFNVGTYLVEWQEYFSVGAADVSTIATVLTAGAHLIGIVSGALCKRFGCRKIMILGAILTTAGSFLASFSTELWHLYIYGTVVGIGTGISYIASIDIIRFYFQRRLGFANGMAYAGFGAGLLAMAPLIEKLCSFYGWQGALLIHAALNANMVVCGALFRPSILEKHALGQRRIKHSAPSQVPSNESEDVDIKPRRPFCYRLIHKINHSFNFTSLIKNRLYVVFTLVTVFTFWVNVSTLVYTPSKLVYDLEFDKTTASLALSVYGICSVVSQVFHGFLLDYKLITVTNLYLVAVISVGSNPLFSPLVTSVAGQFILMAIFGVGSGVFNPVTILVCRQYVPSEAASNATGIMVAIGSIGVILGSELMGKLAEATGSYDIPFYINGALMWSAAFVMAFVTKCSCWKETKPSNTDEESASEDGDDVIASCDLCDHEPLQIGYESVPTSRSLTTEEVETIA